MKVVAAADWTCLSRFCLLALDWTSHFSYVPLQYVIVRTVQFVHLFVSSFLQSPEVLTWYPSYPNGWSRKYNTQREAFFFNNLCRRIWKCSNATANVWRQPSTFCNYWQSVQLSDWNSNIFVSLKLPCLNVSVLLLIYRILFIHSPPKVVSL